MKRSLTPALLSALAAATVVACPALAATPPLPAAKGTLHDCPKIVFKAAHHVTVQTGYAVAKGHHPATKLLSCSNAYTVVSAGKRYGVPPAVGKHVTVGGVRYTLERSQGVGRFGGKALSGPLEGWVGGGVVIPLLIGVWANPDRSSAGPGADGARGDTCAPALSGRA